MSGKSTSPVAAKYARANALVRSVLNKFHNGSARAVDPFVIRALQEREAQLLGIQLFIEQGPAENSRRDKNESHVMDTRHSGGVLGLFTVCGGFSGPGAAMRYWDACSESESEGTGQEGAMSSYITVVDKILPGWDDPTPDHPVASTDRFWQDDAAATHCPQCLVPFSLRERRHHCRLCFAIFCAACCAHVLDVALCPGAPLRPQRVCRPCYQAAYRARKLREAKCISRKNQDLEHQIDAVLATAKQALAAKQQEEKVLRALAIDAGCDLQALGDTIQKQYGGSPLGSATMGMELPAPPAAHRFTPTQTSLESSKQLELAHRHLTMSYKMAQVRAHRLLDKMDATLAALREAVNAKRSMSKAMSPHQQARATDWGVMIRLTDSFLTPADREALQAVSDDLHPRIRSRSSNLTQIALPTTPQDTGIAYRWHVECLKDRRTRTYVADLAEAVRGRLDASSGSDTEDSDANEASMDSTRQLWERSTPVADPTTLMSTPTSTELQKAYELICTQCETGPASEWDEQICLDVARTFGVSARRQYRANLSRTSPSTGNSNGIAIPIEKQRAALQNVLRACASVDTEVGYCQGMDYVAALLLSVSDWQEARAFWLFVSLLSSPRFELERLYGPGLPHLSLRCFQLDRLLRIHLRRVSDHFQAIDFPISIIATGWFMTLFSNLEALSYDVAVHVFEGFIFKGWKQLLQTALVILEELQKPILASSFDEIPRLFYDIQEYAPRLMDPEYVLAESSKYGVSDRTLKRLQKEFEQETPPCEAFTRKPIARKDVLSVKSPADMLNSQHLPKILPSSSPRLSMDPKHQALPPSNRDRTSKAPASTRQATPSFAPSITPRELNGSRSPGC